MLVKVYTEKVRHGFQPHWRTVLKMECSCGCGNGTLKSWHGECPPGILPTHCRSCGSELKYNPGR